MAGNNSYGGKTALVGFLEMIGGVSTETLTGNATINATYGPIIGLDPGGSARDATFASAVEVKGYTFVIVNQADAAEAITVKDSGGSTIGTLAQSKFGIFQYDGSAWIAVVLG